MTRHFQVRMYQRYQIGLSEIQEQELAQQLTKRKRQSDASHLYIRQGSGSKGNKEHQEVWWLRLQGKWILVILDPRAPATFVTALPEWVYQINPPEVYLRILAKKSKAPLACGFG